MTETKSFTDFYQIRTPVSPSEAFNALRTLDESIRWIEPSACLQSVLAARMVLGGGFRLFSIGIPNGIEWNGGARYPINSEVGKDPIGIKDQ